MIFVGLTDEQRRELEVVSRQAVGRVALRAQMVLLSDRGYSVPRIAEIHDCGEDVVRTWLGRYRAEGVAGLADQSRSGRPPKGPLARQVVDAQAQQSPECLGYARTCWTVATLAAFLALRFRLALSPASVRRHLKAMGWRWGRPRLAPASVLRRKRDPEAVAKLAAIAAAAERVAAGVGHLLYLDECDLHLLPVVRAMWMKGPRVRVPTPGKDAKRAFFGALDAASGAFHWADRERKRAVDFVAFLERIAAAYPTGPLFLAMDGAPIHTAKVVAAWLAANPRAQVLWLPRYAAHEANPAERIWGLMKDNVAANRLAGDLDHLVACAQRSFGALKPQPVALPEVA